MQEQLQQSYKLFSKLILGDLVREGTSTSIKNSLVNIYTMDDECETLRYSRLSGILTIDIDRKLKSTFFRMYSMDSFELIFECELYYGFEEYYRQITETLWAFEFLEGIIAFQFISAAEGVEMETAVKKHSHKMAEYFGILQGRRKQEQTRKKQQSFFGKVRSIFSKDGGNKKQKEETKIMAVKKENSVSFDQTTGKFENIPPHLELAFSQLGFSRKELENKKMARHLIEDLVDYELMRKAADDPSATELRKTLRQMGLSTEKLQNQEFQSKFTSQIPEISLTSPFGTLPPPPPPPPLPPVLNPPPPQVTLSKTSPTPIGLNQKADLLQQIRTGIKLNPVSKSQNKITIEIASMDKDQRQNVSNYLRRRLKEREAYERRNKSKDSDEQC